MRVLTSQRFCLIPKSWRNIGDPAAPESRKEWKWNVTTKKAQMRQHPRQEGRNTLQTSNSILTDLIEYVYASRR